MNILAVESSCDETAVAIVRDGREVLTDCIASQVDLHRIYGGVVPEIASRKHIEAIYGLADQALARTGLSRNDIDAVAVTIIWTASPTASKISGKYSKRPPRTRAIPTRYSSWMTVSRVRR